VLNFKKFKIKKHFLWSVLIILLLSNFVLIGITTRNLINKKSEDINNSSQQDTSDFYNHLCPDIEMRNIQEEGVKLTDFIENIIIIQFTEFLYDEFPNLIYLDHLYKCSQGKVKLFFIYPFESRFSGFIDDFNSLSVPIIEDDGSIAAVFNAVRNDTIIVGKDFKMKFKNNLFRKYTIYNQVKKFLGEDFPNPFTSQEDLSSYLKRINYKNIESEQTENLGTTIMDKHSIVNIFISTCLDCPDHERIKLINEAAYEAHADKKQIILLFGYGNRFEIVKEFWLKNNLRNMTVGVIQDSDQLHQYNYYRIFKLNIDPRMFVFHKDGNLTFVEDIKNRRKITSDIIIKKLSQ
jgi:hypothetical protein